MIIGYTTGVFDMFHIGHLNILENAKNSCDYLIVGVSTDDLVLSEKNHLPVIPYDDRVRILKSIRYVDKVVPQKDKNKFAAWEKYHFNKMYVGSDWKGSTIWDNYEKQFQSTDVEIIYLPHTPNISSTIIRNRIKKNDEY